MRKQIQNSCLWILFTLLFAAARYVSGLLLTIYIICGLIGEPDVVNAVALWTCFGVNVGSGVLIGIMSGTEKAIERAENE